VEIMRSLERTRVDRRRFRRARNGTTAVVLAHEGRTGVFAIHCISAGGARVAGRLPLSPGELIAITFELDDRLFALTAHVVRVEMRGKHEEVALEFRDVPVATRDLIDDIVSFKLEQEIERDLVVHAVSAELD
jgi:hypothetical protein